MKIKKVRGYIFCRSFMGERAPQHVQNIVIRDYCKKKKAFIFIKRNRIWNGKFSSNVEEGFS